ncbi:hypothetical protein [Nocardia sp. NRRL S-836]|uniref:hypothetical protein n=1 Tax=Nocardia sp. NRRL S-836 TaxID=1519492 RepID=UPI0012F756FF|nr:hypothetical protein [Nocardia sp. NRRL S-836]
MNRRKLRLLVDEVTRDLDLPPGATHRDASRRVCELMGERLGRPVEVRFAAITGTTCLSGATALLENGTYLVICADSPSWYHRLHVLLHEFAHALLRHEPVTLTKSEGMRKLAPNLLPRMAQIIAGRTALTDDEEREAENLADHLLERLTEHHVWADTVATDTAPHVRRIAESLEGRSRWVRRGDL